MRQQSSRCPDLDVPPAVRFPEPRGRRRTVRRPRAAASPALRAPWRPVSGSHRRGSPRGTRCAWCPGWAARARPGRAPRPRRPAPVLRRGERRRRGCRRRSRTLAASRPAGSAGCPPGSRRRKRWPGASAPVRKPRPSTPKATTRTPLSPHHGITSLSGSRVHSENSLCSALTGCVAWARASSSTVHSDMPRRRTLPAARARRAHRSSPRSARRDPRGAGSRGRGTSMPRRASEVSQCRRIVSGRPSRRSCAAGTRGSRGRTWRRSVPRRAVAQRAADELLVMAAAVQRGRVEVRHAQLDRALRSVRSETASSCGSR